MLAVECPPARIGERRMQTPQLFLLLLYLGLFLGRQISTWSQAGAFLNQSRTCLSPNVVIRNTIEEFRAWSSALDQLRRCGGNSMCVPS